MGRMRIDRKHPTLALLAAALPVLAAVALAMAVPGGVRAQTAPPAPPGAPPGPPPPRIQFDSKEGDLGQVVAGESAKKVFRFKNAGGSTLEIRRVKPSCGCTAALLTADRVEPGGSGEIQVTFDSAGRPRGYQEITVTVFSNDPAERDFGDAISMLRLRVEVTSLIRAVPDVAYFQEVLRGTPEVRKVLLLPEDRPELKVLSIETPSPWIEVETAAVEREKKRGAELVVRVKPDAPAGRLEGVVLVKTDHPRQREIRVPVIGMVFGPVRFFPERLVMHPYGFESGAETSIQIERTAGEGGVKVLAVETPPHYEASVEEIVPGRRAEVVLKLEPDAPRGPFAGVIRVFLAEKDQPVIEVPIYGDLPHLVHADPPAVRLDAGEERTVRLVAARADVAKRLAPKLGEIVPAGIQAELRGQTVTVRLVPDHMGPIQGTLRIHTGIAEDPIIEVPLRAPPQKGGR